LLSLNDPLWNQLESNYGTGEAVVRLLSMASAGEPIHKWYDQLIQELLHQYTLSQAAYAAVPHLVDIAKIRSDARKDLVVLVGLCYANAEVEGAPVLPADLEQEWHAARHAALPVLLEVFEDPQLNENDIRYLLSSLAAIKGQYELSIAIEALDTEIECPECGNWIKLSGSLE
jgi:hypothetical protein